MDKVTTWAVGLVLTVYGAILRMLYVSNSRKLDREECAANQSRCQLVAKWEEFERNQDRRWEQLGRWIERLEKKLDRHLEGHK